MGNETRPARGSSAQIFPDAAQSRRDRFVVGVAVAFVAAVWATWPSCFIADDSYFYLVIARNLAIDGAQTFSGIVPTNGFHPLWQYVLAGFYAVVAKVDPTALRWAGLVAIPAAACLWVGADQLCRAARRAGVSPLLVVGVPLTFLSVLGVLGSEAHAQFAALGALTHRCLRDDGGTPRGSVAIGLLAGLLVLSRLDAALIVVVLLVWHLRAHASLRSTVAVGLTAGVVVAPYLASNWVFFGGLMPVSGWMKSSFPSVFLKGLDRDGLSTRLGGYAVLFGWSSLIAAPWLLWAGAKSRARTWTASVLLAGSALQCVYIVLFTRSHTGWHWYYVPNAVLVGLAAGIAAESRLRRRPALLRPLAAAVGILLVLGFVRIVRKQYEPLGPSVGNVVARTLRGRLDPTGALLVSDWPGEIAFHLPNPVLAPDFLTSNRTFYEELRSSRRPLERLFDAAAQAGTPIAYIVACGNNWLRLDSTGRILTFHDPRAYPRLVPLGKIRLSSEPVLVADEVGLRVWRAAGVTLE